MAATVRLKQSLPRVLLFVVALMLGVVGGGESATAQPPSIRIGSTAGINWSKLIQPVDPRGSITLMHGTAFDGFGFTLGGTFNATLTKVESLPVGIGIDVLYSRHRASGFEKNSDTGAKRTAVLTADVLRVPALARLQLTRAPRGGPYVELGPELWMGLQSGAEVTLENVQGEATPLQTTPVIHPILNVGVGYSFPASPNFSFPIEIRGMWDPFVGKTTVDRFQDYLTSTRPGKYEVAFNWQLMLMTGFSWDLPQ